MVKSADWARKGKKMKIAKQKSAKMYFYALSIPVPTFGLDVSVLEKL
jgi:hypothetical protein